MKNCPGCGGENRDAAKFCLTCGSRFPLVMPPAPVPITVAAVAPVVAAPVTAAAVAPEPPPAPAAAETAPDDDAFWPAADPPAGNRCRSCLADNEPDCRFCESCGAPLAEAEAAPAPPPPVELAPVELAPVELAPVELAPDLLPPPPAPEPLSRVDAAPDAPEVRCPACDAVVRFCPCCGAPLIARGS